MPDQAQLNINDMMVFLSVVESGSFTLAGERLGIPKANVSRKVSRLEDRLGVRLLERTTRAQHLTEAGKRYLSHCKRIQQEVDLAEIAVSELTENYVGNLRIGASVAIGQQILKPELARFLHQYPDLNLQLNLVNRRVDLIEEGFDLLIRVGDLEDSNLVAKPLGQVKRKLFCSPSYLNKFGITSIDSITDTAVLMMGNIHGPHVLKLNDGKQEKTFNLTPRLVADDFAIVKQGVIDGLGLGLFPEYMCAKEVQDGTLVPALSDWGSEPVTIYALYPRHRVKIPKVSAFLDFCLEVFERRLAQ